MQIGYWTGFGIAICIVSLLGVLIVASLAHQWWLGHRIEEQNNDWLDTVKAMSEKLKGDHAKTAKQGKDDE